ncbi:hypothetical protein [Streptomyces sp. NPDC058644]|uniref:hypothetical protein n=1 Tax=unclassified Streptomyces TaxID=2593676 RepID=UPI00365B2560
MLHECDTVSVERFHGVISDAGIGPSVELIKEVVRRGVERGEARAEAMHPCVRDVIPAMTI